MMYDENVEVKWKYKDDEDVGLKHSDWPTMFHHMIMQNLEGVYR